MYTNRTGNVKRFFSICENEKVLDVTQDMLASVSAVKKETFDYIFWQLDFSGADNAIETTVHKLLRRLRSAGRLVIYCDNPYSVHRFACGFAAKEAGESRAAGCSYGQLERMAGNLPQGFCAQWFYPYPNVEFPCAIYSDTYLPHRGECDDNFYSFDAARLETFDEKAVTDSLVTDGMYPYLAHAYMLVLSRQTKEQEKTELPRFTRFSNERRKETQIRTDIYADYVAKTAMQSEARAHINRMTVHGALLGDLLSELVIAGRKCQMNERINADEERGSITFAFVEGESLETFLDRLLLQGKGKEVKEELLAICRSLRELADGQPFQMTEAFQEVFGLQNTEALLQESLFSLPVSDIDMVCQNILLTRERAVVIDYEWTFDFPIPVDYLAFRLLYFYLEGKNRSCMENEIFGDLYQKAGITETLRRSFIGMETSFQRYVQKDAKVLRNAFDLQGRPVLRHSQLRSQLEELDAWRAEICYKDGEHRTAYGKQEREGVHTLYLETRKNTQLTLSICSRRQEPADRLYRIGALAQEGGRQSGISFETNGTLLGGLLYRFKGVIPQITFSHLEEKTEYLHLSIEEIKLTEAAGRELFQLLSDQQLIIANREQQLAELKNSASWKLTKPLRRIKGNKEE